MLCGICSVQEAKYRCPKCSVQYCSLLCFKSEAHVHTENTEKPAEEPVVADQPVSTNSIYERIAQDEQIRSMLRYDSLKFHLSVICQILDDPQLSGESTASARREVANAKLTQLREGGVEENELVEDFVSRVLYLMEREQGGKAT